MCFEIYFLLYERSGAGGRTPPMIHDTKSNPVNTSGPRTRQDSIWCHVSNFLKAPQTVSAVLPAFVLDLKAIENSSNGCDNKFTSNAQPIYINGPTARRFEGQRCDLQRSGTKQKLEGQLRNLEIPQKLKC